MRQHLVISNKGFTVSGDEAVVEARSFVCDDKDEICTGCWGGVLGNGDECRGGIQTDIAGGFMGLVEREESCCARAQRCGACQTRARCAPMTNRSCLAETVGSLKAKCLERKVSLVDGYHGPSTGVVRI